MRTTLYFAVLSSMVLGCAQGGGRADGGGGPGRDSGQVEHDAHVPPQDGGACPMTCPSGTVCRGTTCVATCSPDDPCEGGRTCCGGACVNTMTSLTDCGSCGNSCEGRANVCAGGECRCGAGPACTGTELCCEGRCVDIATDTQACGGCGIRCEPGQICEAARCVDPPCDPPCAAGETCGPGGTCMCGTGPACGPGRACCGGTCVDVQTDGTNCGVCGNVCASGLVCLGGSCTADVPCSPPCGPGQTCMAGSCRCGTSGPCAGGLVCCGGTCVNTTHGDPNNCGGCGRACLLNANNCQDGMCVCGNMGRPCDGLCVQPFPFLPAECIE